MRCSLCTHNEGVETAPIQHSPLSKISHIAAGVLLLTAGLAIGSTGLAGKIAGMKRWHCILSMSAGAALAVALIALGATKKSRKAASAPVNDEPLDPKSTWPAHIRPADVDFYIPMENVMRMDTDFANELRYGSHPKHPDLDAMLLEEKRGGFRDTGRFTVEQFDQAIAHKTWILEQLTARLRDRQAWDPQNEFVYSDDNFTRNFFYRFKPYSEQGIGFPDTAFGHAALNYLEAFSEQFGAIEALFELIDRARKEFAVVARLEQHFAPQR